MDDYDQKIGGILDIKPPLHTELKAQYKKSFAYYSYRYRIPTILDSLLASLNSDKEIEDARSGDDFKFVVNSIEKLKTEIVENAKFELFKLNGKTWNFVDQT